jgi:putative addiction module CopG family antidote
MSNIIINLPDALKDFIVAQTAKGGFSSEGDYLQNLVREAQIREARQELEAKLIKGLDSPLSTMTADDWTDLKLQVLQRSPEANGP